MKLNYRYLPSAVTYLALSIYLFYLGVTWDSATYKDIGWFFIICATIFISAGLLGFLNIAKLKHLTLGLIILKLIITLFFFAIFFVDPRLLIYSFITLIPFILTLTPGLFPRAKEKEEVRKE